ncbi:hypothetical protein RB653_006861 [Dictyostelium firmibasis]|uniref:WD40 repeat-like protein n=1 Tax=Dictyostelium firmibasis TaxID=79012 RepID=A0AAN7TTP2_9MYCE
MNEINNINNNINNNNNNNQNENENYIQNIIPIIIEEPVLIDNNNNSNNSNSINDDKLIEHNDNNEDEQLKLKKLLLKRQLGINENENDFIQQQQQQEEIKSIVEEENLNIVNEENRKQQILIESFIDFQNSLKEYCSGPIILNEDQSNNSLEKFYKGSKWSPDGTCLLSCTEDKFIRLFEINNNYNENNEILNIDKAVIEIKEFESIYDYCWYPLMNSNNPATCCFLTSSKEYPITLWDAFNGNKRCTYKPYKDVDDLESAYSIQFNSNGTKIYSGFKNSIKIFDIDRPGDYYNEIKTTFKKNKNKNKKRIKGNSYGNEENLNLSGIISCITFDKQSSSGFFAASTYNGNIGLFDERMDELVDILPDPINLTSQQNHSDKMNINTKMGITQIMFSPKDSNYLFASFRKSNYIIGWDIRNTVAQQVYQLYRPLSSHQRLQFDIDPFSSRYLSTGSQNGQLLIYDLFNNGNLIYSNNSLNQSLSLINNENNNNYNNNQSDNICINSTSFHPFLPLISLTFGERQFNLNSNNNNNNNLKSFSILKY